MTRSKSAVWDSPQVWSQMCVKPVVEKKERQTQEEAKGMKRGQLGKSQFVLKGNQKLIRNCAIYVVFIIFLMCFNNPALLLAADSPSSLSSWVSPLDPNHEQAILAAVNRLRLREGLSELKLNEAAREKAREQSVSMAEHTFLAHKDHLGRSLKERLVDYPSLQFRNAGENVARNRGFSNPAAEAISGWVNSPGHLANMLDTRFTETGVGIALDSEGMFYFTQIFLSK